MMLKISTVLTNSEVFRKDSCGTIGKELDGTIQSKMEIDLLHCKLMIWIYTS